MNVVTSTELRTKTSSIINTLLSGGTIDLIHRSRLVGEIVPKKRVAKVFDVKKMTRIINDLDFQPLSDKEIERRYRKHIMKKYGKYLPRHQ